MTDTNTEEAVRVLVRQNDHSAAKQVASRKRLPPLASPVSPGHKNRPQSDVSVEPKDRSGRGASRLKMRHILILGMAALVALKPWLVFWSVVFVLAIAIILFFSLDQEACSRKIGRAFRRFAKRRPEAAENLRQTAKRYTQRLERLAGKLPDRWVSGLYLPDFEVADDDDPLENRPDPFERLKSAYKDL